MLDLLLQYLPQRLHTGYLQLLENIPAHARNVAVVGDTCGVVGHLLKRRTGAYVVGFLSDARLAPVVGAMVDQVITDSGEIPAPEFDAMVLCSVERADGPALARWLEVLVPRLIPFAPVYSLYSDPAFGRAEAPALDDVARKTNHALAAADFHPYTEWSVNDERDREPIAVGRLSMAVRADYNPILHARALCDTGEMSGAYHVLDLVPWTYTQRPESRKAIFLEKLATLTLWIGRESGNDVSHLLASARIYFDAIDHEWPGHVEAYQMMAQCWTQAGNVPMARRLLRTVRYHVPTPAVEQQLQRLPATPAPATSVLDVPRWEGEWPLRVLFLIHSRPHYGLDTLFDGLCACLGDENVVAYPWKPTLHGGDTAEHGNYPCRFARRGEPRTAAQVVEELQAGAFDIILYGDVEGALPAADIQAILHARGDRPVFLIDAMDQMSNYRQPVRQRLGLDDFEGYFKREMVWSIDYGPNAFPLPFAYSEPAALDVPDDRRDGFFWAGHRNFGQRRVFVEALEARHGWQLDRQFTQEEYQQRLHSSRIGLNCFGMGFDTVRYWEIPAHGCMLLSDRLPIRVPFDFQDGVHAVFFDDLPDLLAKTEYYLAHPAEVATIAAAGQAHYRAYHTSEARARQLLGWVAAIRRDGGSSWRPAIEAI